LIRFDNDIGLKLSSLHDRHNTKLNHKREDARTLTSSMSEGSTKEETEEPIRYHHDFNKDELAQMLYQWDDKADPVKEYHYMKAEWQTEEAIIGKKPKGWVAPKVVEHKKNMTTGVLKVGAKDTSDRTMVDLSNGAPGDEELIYLDLDTNAGVHVVEFYAPWCGHCQHFKTHYVELAREVTRRVIGTPVHFHALSCQLYREICRAYEISGFPLVVGYGIGMNIAELGYELNPTGMKITAETIADTLHLTLAHEIKDVPKERSFDSLEEKDAFYAKQKQLPIEAANRKLSWQEFSSSLNERYHNAAQSLAFALKTGVFVKTSTSLDDKKALVLQEFLELVEWTTPPNWHVRTGMVQEILNNMGKIVNQGLGVLTEIVERHQSLHVENGLWGDLHVQTHGSKRLGLGGDVPQKKETNADEVYWENNRWTEACTHNERGMGYTCGLWDLLHIVTIGSSMPIHQLYGFNSGYLTAPSQIAEVIKRFISSFFACNVCRWHFVDMYESCGHNRCKRLSSELPELTSNPIQTSRELSLWLWEVHNAVNVRLMKEAAMREERDVTDAEKLAAVFPSPKLCPKCWVNEESLKEYREQEVFEFLSRYYWPARESLDLSFKAVIHRQLGENMLAKKSFSDSHFYIIAFLLLFAGTLIRHALDKQTTDHSRKKL